MKNTRKFRKKKRYGFLKKVLILVLLLGVALLAINLLFRIDKVTVEGSNRYTEDEIKEFVLADQLDYNSLYLYLKYKYSEQEKIPFIQKISIKMVSRHEVKIRVYEKGVTGCVEFMGEYMYFDKDGIIVESASEKESDVPLITGLSFTRIALHQQLLVQKQQLFEVILNLTQLIRKYELTVDKITFDSSFNVTLTCGNIYVLLGQHDFYDEPIANLKNILEKLDNRNLTLDMKNYQSGDTVIAIDRDEKQ